MKCKQVAVEKLWRSLLGRKSSPNIEDYAHKSHTCQWYTIFSPCQAVMHTTNMVGNNRYVQLFTTLCLPCCHPVSIFWHQLLFSEMKETPQRVASKLQNGPTLAPPHPLTEDISKQCTYRKVYAICLKFLNRPIVSLEKHMLKSTYQRSQRISGDFDNSNTLRMPNI